MLLMWQGEYQSCDPFAQVLTKHMQVTGDLWERYLQLIADPRKTDGYVVHPRDLLDVLAHI